jgi:hypothetical protein
MAKTARAEGPGDAAAGSAVTLVPGSPRKWKLDERGRPLWVAALPGTRWAPVFEWELMRGRALRLELPLLDLGLVSGNGHRRREADDRSETARLAAGLHDVWRYSYDYIGRQVRNSRRAAGDHELAGRNFAQKGRRLLHDEGVLPWVAFRPDGSLPKRWWRSDEFLAALGEWTVTPNGHDELADLGVGAWPIRGAAAITELVQLELRVAQAVVRTLARR